MYELPDLSNTDRKSHQEKEFARINTEWSARRIEALNLYEPLPFQQRYHACLAKEVILRKATQTGGSLAGFVEDARAVLARDPFGKYPKTGVLVCLGFGEKHIGRVIHQYLFRPGAFQIIRDLETKEWRTFRPWKGTFANKVGDAGREDEARPAPPLIPQRYIEGSISWEKRSEHIFSYVKLITGWEIYAANTAGDPNQFQGFKADLVHLDEDTASEGWYREMVSRCAIRKGKLRWTAVPHAKNEELMNLIERAEDEAEMDTPTTVLITATMYDNPYYPEESRVANAKLWKSEGDDIYRQRALGEAAISHILMYPNFNLDIHEAMKQDEPRLQVQDILVKNQGVPPKDWMRVMGVDPGHTVCAVLFAAIPPVEQFGDHCVIYKELYIRNCDASIFGNEVRKAFQDEHTQFQRFIIDAHGGNIRDIGSGITPRKQYEDQLKKHGISSIDTGSRFRDGCDDIKGRESVLREWLRIRSDGTTKLLFISSQCPMLCKEMKKFKKKTISKGGGMQEILDEGNRRSNTHAVETLEQLVADGLNFQKPRVNVVKESFVDRMIAARKHRDAQRAAKYFGQGGRTIDLGPRGSRRS